MNSNYFKFLGFTILLFTYQLVYSQQTNNIKLLNLKGDAIAIQAASMLLENAGGIEVWKMNSFVVYERAFFTNGNIAQLKITRDLERITRKIESTTDSTKFIEVIEVKEGCTSTNSTVQPIDDKTLKKEREGLMQSPYFIYHRLAIEDPSISVELTDEGNKLNIFQEGDKLLCWFLIDRKGQQYSWGNIYNGKVNQHFYGPYEKMGDAKFPKWGAAMDGGFRFEYIHSEFSQESIELNCKTP